MASLGGDLLRLARAGWVLARHDALLPDAHRAAVPAPVRWLGWAARLGAGRGARPGSALQADASHGERFAAALEQLGPAYVKLGQFLATRGDMVGPEFAAGLAGLKDRAAPFTTDAAREALEAEFPGRAEHLFGPLGASVAAASVAQVHKVTMRDGRVCAVKILRPQIETRVARDISALRRAARWAHALVPASRRLEPIAFVDTIAKAAHREMDLRLEAAAASEMSETAPPGFHPAQVDWSRSGKRVLTTDWMDGPALSDAAGLEAAGVDRAALAVTVIRVFLSCALDTGVFHADMHEGNLFALPQGSPSQAPPYPANLGAVDFGIVGRIGPKERRYLAEILHGFLQRDYARIAEVHFEAGYVPAHQDVSEFAAALRAVGEPIFGKSAGEVSMGRLLLQLFEVTAQFDMHLRPELVLLQKTMVQAEGVARGLDPAFDMWEAARPVVAGFMRRELGPEGLVRDAAADVSRLRAAVRRLPQALEDLNAAADTAAGAGWRLDDETVARLARAQARATRGRTFATWVLALAATALAAAGVAAAIGG